MKEYTVRYSWGNRVFESTVRTDSTASALIWVTDVLRGCNPYVVSWKEVEE